MLQYVTPLKKITEPGIVLVKTEVLKRYRALQNHNRQLLQLLFMLPFSKLELDEDGNLLIT